MKIWRDSSPPAFTAETPFGSHAAWYCTDDKGKDFGPYFTRSDAEKVALMLEYASEDDDLGGSKPSDPDDGLDEQ